MPDVRTTPDFLRSFIGASFYVDHLVIGDVHRHLTIAPARIGRNATTPAAWGLAAKTGHKLYVINLETYRALESAIANHDGSITLKDGTVASLEAVDGVAEIVPVHGPAPLEQ